MSIKVLDIKMNSSKWTDSLRVARFLAIRAIKNSSKWTTGLIIFVMVLTFLNLVVVSGILVGLIQGSETAFRERFIGDLGISKLDKKSYVENADAIVNIVTNETVRPGMTAPFDQARMDVGREKLEVYKEGGEDTPAITASGAFGKAAEEHLANFLECVRTRATPNATVEKGFQAALVVQLANLSLRQGRRMKWNAALQRIEA